VLCYDNWKENPYPSAAILSIVFFASWTSNTKKYSIKESKDFMANDLATARNEGKIIQVFLHNYGRDNLPQVYSLLMLTPLNLKRSYT